MKDNSGRAMAVVLSFILVATSESSSATDIGAADLQRCAVIEAAAARLACYDELAGRQGVAAAAPNVTSGEAESAEAAEDTSSERRSRSDDDELRVRARVTRCEKDARKKVYFVFDNGEVWRQGSDKRLRFRDCEFEVTITKDFFGHKMQIDGEKRPIRIVRVN